MDANHCEHADRRPARSLSWQPDLERGLGAWTNESPAAPNLQPQTAAHNLHHSRTQEESDHMGRTTVASSMSLGHSRTGPCDKPTSQPTTTEANDRPRPSSGLSVEPAESASLERKAIQSSTLGDFDAWNRELYTATAIMRRTGFQPAVPCGITIDLSAMQMLTIRRLQSKLVRQALEHLYSDEEGPDPAWLSDGADYASSTMRQYVMALQDYDYMVKRADELLHGPDPFSIGCTMPCRRLHGETPFPDYALLREHLESMANAQSNGDSASKSHRSEILSDLLLLESTRRKPAAKDELKVWRRTVAATKTTVKSYAVAFGAALAASALLVLPMIIILLFFPGQARQPEAATVATGFIAFFALTAAWTLKDVFRVVSATAAYAAVLVVFVAAH